MKSLLILSVLFLFSCVSHEIQVPPDATPIALFGEGCASDSTCETGSCKQTYKEYELPDGMCTVECVWGSPCDEGYCVFEENNVGSCFPSCEENDSPCREGWSCYFIVGVRLCAPEGW